MISMTDFIIILFAINPLSKILFLLTIGINEKFSWWLSVIVISTVFGGMCLIVGGIFFQYHQNEWIWLNEMVSLSPKITGLILLFSSINCSQKDRLPFKGFFFAFFPLGIPLIVGPATLILSIKMIQDRGIFPAICTLIWAFLINAFIMLSSFFLKSGFSEKPLRKINFKRCLSVVTFCFGIVFLFL